MTALVARTLAEAHTYLGLLAAAEDGAAEDGTGNDAAGQTAAETITAEAERSWTLSYRDRIAIEVPYASEEAARSVGARYGLGVSRLIDAGQWFLVAQTYAERAVAAITASGVSADDAERRTKLELDWELAVDALDEALKFFEPGESELRDGALWSDQGRRLVVEEPESLTRDTLLDALASYRGVLADLRSLHDNSPPG
jgi:hypothetical protein